MFVGKFGKMKKKRRKTMSEHDVSNFVSNFYQQIAFKGVFKTIAAKQTLDHVSPPTIKLG